MFLTPVKLFSYSVWILLKYTEKLFDISLPCFTVNALLQTLFCCIAWWTKTKHIKFCQGMSFATDGYLWAQISEYLSRTSLLLCNLRMFDAVKQILCWKSCQTWVKQLHKVASVSVVLFKQSNYAVIQQDIVNHLHSICYRYSKEASGTAKKLQVQQRNDAVLFVSPENLHNHYETPYFAFKHEFYHAIVYYSLYP